MKAEKIHFVTGRLAEEALRSTLRSISPNIGFEYTIQVMPITVAALMTPAWIAKRLDVPPGTSRVVLPGYCDGDLKPVNEVTSVPIQVGPRDLRRLPEFFGSKSSLDPFGKWDIEIIAEINHAPQLALKTILQLANDLRNDGADIIDVGCEPGADWIDVAECVQMLRGEGHRVSIDSLNPREISSACAAGAELVLSVNKTNREFAPDWGSKVVVIPDDIANFESMTETMEFLCNHNVSFRIDPILEPIGFGFAASLQRYFSARERWPDAEIMMGIGNLTELTDVDSAGINVLLLAICQELDIRSVLTTQVINWARSSVRECSLARQLVYHSITHRVPPKHLSDQLVMLRDAKLVDFGDQQLEHLAAAIKDNNYRIFAEGGLIHLLGNGRRLSSNDPFDLFDQLADTNPRNLDPSHAFYLGFEMSKALTALQLGKQYTQDESLNWGMLTENEVTTHRLRKRKSLQDHDSA